MADRGHMRPSRLPSHSSMYEIPFSASDADKEGYSAGKKGKKPQRWNFASYRVFSLAVMALTVITFTWIYKETIILDNIERLHGAYSGFLASRKQDPLSKLELYLKREMADLRMTLEHGLMNVNQESQTTLKKVDSHTSSLEKSLDALKKRLEGDLGKKQSEQEVKDKEASKKLLESIQKGVRVVQDQLDTQDEEALSRLAAQMDGLSSRLSELEKQSREASEKLLALADVAAKTENRLVHLSKGQGLSGGGDASGKKGEGNNNGNLGTLVTLLSEVNETQYKAVQSLQTHTAEVLSRVVEHSGRLAEMLASQSITSKDTSKHVTSGKNPFLWRQRTFQAHLFHHFVQFSGYRKGAKSFVAIGLSVLESKEQRKLIDCSWHYAGGVDIGKLRVIYPGEHHNKLYEAIVLICDMQNVALPGGYLTMRINFEEFVVFREDDFDADLEPSQALPHQCTLCSAPMFGHNFPLQRVRQFVEYYKLMEVTHFHFYDAGGFHNSEFNGLFSKDVEQKVVEVSDFRDVENLESWYHGQLLAIQDCLYRSRWDSRWVLFADFDEYFWPKPPNTLKYLLETHEGSAGFTHGAYWFSVFKCRGGKTKGSSTVRRAVFGDQFEVEKFTFRWPKPACFQEGADPYLCLADKGHRKVVINPRKAEYLCIHGPQWGDTSFPPLDHLRADVAAHAHFQYFIGGSGYTMCNETVAQGEKLDWWAEDNAFPDHVEHLRKYHQCDFRGKGCVSISHQRGNHTH